VAEDDYDYEAWQRANPDAVMAPGQHYPDTYKRPNHPTFSNESMYHGQGGAEGGQWEVGRDGKWMFTPGRTNLEHYSVEELQDYFKRVEPDSKLNLPSEMPGFPYEF
jgi:hypothetical protein